MEINELRYFLAVAEKQSVNQAAKMLAISAGSLSKAVQKLETELGVNLFERVGRNIKITDHGRSLQLKASQILNLEEKTRLEISGSPQEIQITICGEELLLAHFTPKMVSTISQLNPRARFSFVSTSKAESIRKIEFGEAHLALSTASPEENRGFSSKTLAKTLFQTCVGVEHPLYEYADKGTAIAIEKVLEFPFALPAQNLLGQTKGKQSVDGWRDDKFPREIGFRTSSIKILETLIVSGQAIAYIPDYLANEINVKVLNVTGCPYYCEQDIYLICRDQQEFGWLNQIW